MPYGTNARRLCFIHTGFFVVIFPRDCLRTVIFIIAVIFEVESDGAGKREASGNLCCISLYNRHGCGFRCYSGSFECIQSAIPSSSMVWLVTVGFILLSLLFEEAT